MEYRGSGDPSTIIKQATKQNRPLPEDTIWNHFLQILLALHYCHHPNVHTGTAAGGSANFTASYWAFGHRCELEADANFTKPDDGRSEFQ